eukprot:GHVH01000120.1.p1 GENE.GHVH01000120.1~~GHVH01000120.1.p1  ORF type:complete len:212 (+),score=28.88 GHVH01000120.1:86-721(+)
MARKYQSECPAVGTCARAMRRDEKVSFKNMYSVTRVLRGMEVAKAKTYLDQVLDKKRCIPMIRYNENCGRTPQAKEWGTDLGRWPTNSCLSAYKMICKAEANAKDQGLENVDEMVIYQFHVNKATGARRRNFGAHGRIKPSNRQPCHVQIIISPKEHTIRTPKKKPAISAKAVYVEVIKVGGGQLGNVETVSKKELAMMRLSKRKYTLTEA